MSDRIKGFWVALDKDYRDDDLEPIKDAVLMIKGVESVAVSTADSSDWMNRARVKSELITQLWNVIKNA